MQYPLYDYYYESDLTLDEIIEHYGENFYLRKHGRDKYEKVLKKISESEKVMELFNTSYQLKLSLTYMDFGATINKIMWFFFQSNDTQALAILAMASFWNVNVNSHLHLRSEGNLRDEALKVLKKYSMYGEMTQEEFEKMTNPKPDYSIYENEDDDKEDVIGNSSGCVNGSENNKSYHILNFYLDCSYWHKQEDEIKKSPLILPIQIVDVDKEDEMVEKYNVRNLPTLILVDDEGAEIHRWVGVTPASEINTYVIENGYSKTNDFEGLTNEEKMDLSCIPIEFRDKINDLEFQDKVIAILADGGTEDQINEKINYLLGRNKSDEVTVLEERIRQFIREKFDTIGNLIFRDSNNFDIIHKIKATTMLSKLNDDLDGGDVFPDVERIRDAANRVGISWNLIKDEEYKRAILIYRDGKQVD